MINNVLRPSNAVSSLQASSYICMLSVHYTIDILKRIDGARHEATWISIGRVMIPEGGSRWVRRYSVETFPYS